MQTNVKCLWPAVAALALAAPIHTMAAEGPAYLAPQSAAAVLADGAPWSAQAPNGRAFKLTLNKGGKGRISGPANFALSVSWAVKGDAVCLSGTMMSKCLRFREIPGGLQGWVEDKPDLKLTR